MSFDSGSGGGGVGGVGGARIELKIAYEKVPSYLSVTIFRCENLINAHNRKETYDPYALL